MHTDVFALQKDVPFVGFVETQVARVDFPGEYHERSARTRLRKKRNQNRVNPKEGRAFLCVLSAVEMEIARVDLGLTRQ